MPTPRSTSKGQTTVTVEIHRHRKSTDATAQVRPAPDVMALSGAAHSATPRDPSEKTRARNLIGRGDRGQ